MWSNDLMVPPKNFSDASALLCGTVNSQAMARSAKPGGKKPKEEMGEGETEKGGADRGMVDAQMFL